MVETQAPPGPGTVLSIAGHDPSSGAGVTADLQTFAAHGLLGTSAVTALTVQSTLGVAAAEAVSPEFLGHALAHLCADLPPAGIKIGMLGSAGVAATIADFLARLRTAAQGAAVPVVLDPVLRASSGAELLSAEGLRILRDGLLPAVAWITPNWIELAALSGQPVHNLEQAQAAMHWLGCRYPGLHIVATGGDQAEPTDLLRLPSGELRCFAGEHVPTRSTHGTGCAFSSALLSRLVQGADPAEAVAAAKHYVTNALRRAPGIGRGRGPLNLLWPLSHD